MVRQIFFDTETTGLDLSGGDRVVEIGAIEVIDRIATGKIFHCYLNPETRAISSEAESISKLSLEFLKQQPLFGEVWPKFKQFLQGADQLIAHNAEFDISFLDAEISRIEPSMPPMTQCFQVVDSLTLARTKFPGQRNSLDVLCRRYKIDLSQRELKGHGALLDAGLLYQVYSALTAGEQRILDLDISENETGAKEVMSGSEYSSQHSYVPIIIAANEEELDAHRTFLGELQKNSGKAIWSEHYEP